LRGHQRAESRKQKAGAAAKSSVAFPVPQWESADDDATLREKTAKLIVITWEFFNMIFKSKKNIERDNV